MLSLDMTLQGNGYGYYPTRLDALFHGKAQELVRLWNLLEQTDDQDRKSKLVVAIKKINHEQKQREPLLSSARGA